MKLDSILHGKISSSIFEKQIASANEAKSFLFVSVFKFLDYIRYIF